MSELRFEAGHSGRGVHAAFTVAPGETLAIVGPNGAGKSTLLGLVAGLLRPDSGEIRLGDHVLTNCATGTFVPTHRRRTALLLQEALLFPHLTVARNVEFGMRARHRDEVPALRDRWLESVGARDLARRRPGELSGGQAQRVAIARALATEPDLVLLDEPLAGLDAASAPEIRALLGRVLGRGGQSALIVTHDIMDAVAIADRVMVLDSGHIVELGDTATVLARPTSKFGARFAGVNLIAGTVGEDGALHADGIVIHGVWSGADSPEPGQHAVAVFGPRAVGVHLSPPGGSPRNVIAVAVSTLSAHGDSVVVTATAGPAIFTAHITAAAAAELKLAPGESAYFAVKAHEVVIQAAQ
ncbi:ABC transporter ATP-binding protein [Mycobacteroides chelonae]|uniref:ABC transporter ATP-binding protein n=1 Tax=Mycobacteroides chelonae TaxID=1774 RepID=A0AB73U1U1_MYCCH|nr:MULTISPECIES: ABC transporter ATP-binding protein [Mycobacteroides]KRQ31775.1 molybdenum ABC transporter ATP-binding protein [Mycobacteroides sp. H072]KRQ32994.1 molybdenum ABC transporter ATP-binding protein [Mycobacteroides sp. H002]KRQ56705.1 molybdenum ABC transporter ATP-binding protein [Mycobacteroides sp. H054]KRQ65456.1 molybdenum ABC transporter ATP-binding protein [Mycobacteroides sp. H001]MEC4839985.1 ABC transporter ATP-binding protein [Mycobacteroides chelonae]